MSLYEEVYHEGVKRKSGRYEWGSGENPYQHEDWFLNEVHRMKKNGMTETEIAEAMSMTTKVLRERVSIAKDEQKAAKATRAMRLKEKGYTDTKIGEMMGLNESTVRSLLKPGYLERAQQTKQAANTLEVAVKEYGFIDVGPGTSMIMGVSDTKLNTAIRMLKDQGYQTFPLKTEQLGTGFKTTINVLCPPGTEFMDVVRNRDKIRPVCGIPIDKVPEGKDIISKLGLRDPTSVDPKRVGICYAEDGGTEMDGVIQLRPGVPDLTLGEARYAQVRIKVGEDRYLKGMAMYSDDLPKGVDLMFNTNKHKIDPDTGEPNNWKNVLKKIKEDQDNPFGAIIDKQRDYIDSDGEKKLSPINIVREEGKWGDWKRTISSQVLSKQPVDVAKKQLGLDLELKKAEYDEIMSLENPVVQKRLLKTFADDCDASAVHLKAAALPRQGYHVILPFTDMPDNEVYAPNYRQGEPVVLIRYPHGGTFEIPELRVNNNHPSAKKLLGDAKDAVGINAKVAERLSGADFDGDTVLVIPNRTGKIKTSPALKSLENFDPKEMYRAYPGMKTVKDDPAFDTQREMGKISNLITDMTIKGADFDKIAKAVRHSMVVIDAEKHNLNWRQSYIDNGISNLKQEFQGKATGGASTLISRASKEKSVPQRKIGYRVNKETGEKIFTETHDSYKIVDKRTGKEKIVQRKAKSTMMAEVDDAFKLSSGTPIEAVYAEYANSMKKMGDQARKDWASMSLPKANPVAKKMYEKESESLLAKLRIAISNKPLERQAQLQANIVVAAKRNDNPSMDKEELGKVKSQALAAARVRVGASRKQVDVTPKEWEAIQAGAISSTKLAEILDHTDLDVIRNYATPKISSGMSKASIARAEAMLAAGYTQADVADQLGVSVGSLRYAMQKAV